MFQQIFCRLRKCERWNCYYRFFLLKWLDSLSVRCWNCCIEWKNKVRSASTTAYGILWWLKKSIQIKNIFYGLRESSKDCYECFDENKRSIGFVRSVNDYCLYIFREKMTRLIQYYFLIIQWFVVEMNKN